MIEVRAGGKRLVVQGHAGYGPAGQDIVCAAVSALVYALAETLAETGRLAGLDIRKGYAEVTGRGDCAGDFGLVCRGLAMLAERYPQCVKMGS